MRASKRARLLERKIEKAMRIGNTEKADKLVRFEYQPLVQKIVARRGETQ